MARGSDLRLLCLRATEIRLWSLTPIWETPERLVRNKSINDLGFDVMRVGSLID